MRAAGVAVLIVALAPAPAVGAWHPRPDPYDPREAKDYDWTPTIPKHIRFREHWPVPWRVVKVLGTQNGPATDGRAVLFTSARMAEYVGRSPRIPPAGHGKATTKARRWGGREPRPASGR